MCTDVLINFKYNATLIFNLLLKLAYKVIGFVIIFSEIYAVILGSYSSPFPISITSTDTLKYMLMSPGSL